MNNWKRPESIPFPTVWHRFEKKKEDGSVRKFYIQDATEDMGVFLIDHMQKFFTRDEVLSKAAGIVDDPKSLATYAAYWRIILKQRVVLVCFEEDPENPGKPLYFAGCNLTYIATKDDPDIEGTPDQAWYQVFITFLHVLHLKDIYKELKINEYMNAFGLSVVPNFRGLGIGTELLRARNEICKAIGITVTMSCFTSIISQSAARSAGYKEFVSKDYADIKRDVPGCSLDGITNKSLIFLYKEIK